MHCRGRARAWAIDGCGNRRAARRRIFRNRSDLGNRATGRLDGLAALVQGLTTGAALGRAVSGVYGVLEETERRQSSEMALIASAERMLRPHPLFVPSGIPARAGGDPSPIVPAAPS